MKITIPLIAIMMALPLLQCSEMQITGFSVRNELNSTADSIRKNRNYVYKLDDKTVGKKGFFYIIRNNATVSYHPVKALSEYDFSGDPFVQRILKNRNGCVSSCSNEACRYIFFTEIDSNEILCLSIDGTEFGEPVDGCIKAN